MRLPQLDSLGCKLVTDGLGTPAFEVPDVRSFRRGLDKALALNGTLAAAVAEHVERLCKDADVLTAALSPLLLTRKVLGVRSGCFSLQKAPHGALLVPA